MVMDACKFEQKLTVLVAASLSEALKDQDQMGIMIERLSYSLSLVIATAARGNKNNIDELLMGAEGYLAETTLNLIPLAKAMSNPRKGGP